jgi:hypothetical protein
MLGGIAVQHKVLYHDGSKHLKLEPHRKIERRGLFAHYCRSLRVFSQRYPNTDCVLQEHRHNNQAQLSHPVKPQGTIVVRNTRELLHRQVEKHRS